MKLFKTTILILIIICSHTIASAKTIVLLYDNSKSMFVYGNSEYVKFIYANYAAQMLFSYINENDQLYPLLMNSYKEFEKSVFHSNRQNQLDYIRNNWGYQDDDSTEKYYSKLTPYAAVKQSLNLIIQKMQENDDDQNWLIIMTDGIFEYDKGENTGSPVSEDVVISHVDNSLPKTNGKVKIIFLLIGDQVKDDFTSKYWEQKAPNQVHILRAKDDKEIITRMEEIALMITGMDANNKSVHAQQNSITFETIFPLKRISVSIQSTIENLPKISKILHHQSRIPDIQYTTLDIFKDGKRKSKKANEVILKAQVTHCKTKLFPAGNYTVYLDKPVNMYKSQILLDPAIETKIQLTDRHESIVNTQSGVVKTCKDHQMRASIMFHDPQGKKIIFKPFMTDKIQIKAFLDQTLLDYTYDKKKNVYVTDFFSAKESKVTFYADIVYPEYFNYKSNVITIYGEDCAQRSFIKNEVSVYVPYVMSKSYIPLKEIISFEVGSEGTSVYSENAMEVIEAKGLPPGLMFRINNHSLTSQNNKINVSMIRNNDSLKIQVLRNQEYNLTAKVEVKLLLSTSADQLYRWKNYPVISIIPKARNIEIVSPKRKWKAPVTQIENTPPLKIAIQLDGKALSMDEFQQWDIQCDDFTTLPIQESKDKSEPVFYVAPQNCIDLLFFSCPCFTKTGVIETSCNIQGVHENEHYSEPIRFEITDVSLITKCFSFFIGVLLTITFLWWLIGILKKPRFTKGRFVTFKILEKRLEIKSRTEPLIESKVKRWLIPYSPEKKMIRGFTFTPGPFNTLLISKKQMRKNIYIDGVLQDLPWQHDLKLSVNATLSEERDNRVFQYIYQ